MGKVLLLLTISGASTAETVVDLHEYSGNRDQIISKYVKNLLFKLTFILIINVSIIANVIMIRLYT